MEGRYILLFWLIVTGCFSSCGTNQSARHENFIVETITRNVEAEKKGLPHHTSHRDWNAYWVWRINNMRKTPDGEKYEAMVINLRRSAGLPKLR